MFVPACVRVCVCVYVCACMFVCVCVRMFMYMGVCVVLVFVCHWMYPYYETLFLS